MDAQTLAKAMDNRVSMDRYEELCPAWNNALIAADCTTVLRVTMWCSQIGHESGGLKWMEEIASGDAYDTRTDLGNTPQVDGDGRLYKGRGPIQLTGKNNYRSFSRWAASKGLVDDPEYFVKNPLKVAEPHWGFLAAAFYWTVSRRMNDFADRQDLVGATYAVNGGQNGIDDRRKFYYRALALGDALLPQEDDMSNAAEVFDQLMGPVGPDGKRGWPQLGDAEITGIDKRSIVNALGRIIQQENFAIAQNDRIEKSLARIEAKIGTKPEDK
ncbi:MULTISPECIES: hypothetical protein [unclassified Rhodococcus (in: high G+C Gram-positive bacteria)]|uniref:glycoside hydrolase family 19 protein n=1 Tax=unclassified Rhodococcus (in: high G+C Gram-positive bacteria) TaxID=192944 RepID=UPI000B9AB314|nr:MULTISPECIES: hypothetical protein [unclassified Rhodococcus (in: high G+C Gram-positive bacteria)]OZE35596.1 hypothetical protein CH259_16335 [Rhodococcus sp. 05-2254-4]OZE48025.1 hypothetical protein CH261_08930 [Rhodococcus sp. 05-2254-3]OZE49236.1 hypothetical protein CH283_16715 [Rhodococcus sp. 05-2254-2]